MRAGGRGRLRARVQWPGCGWRAAVVPAGGVPGRQAAGELLVPLAGTSSSLVSFLSRES